MNQAQNDRSDENLAELVQVGKVDFFGEIINRYEGKLRGYAYRFLNDRDEIDDLLQQIFIKAYENIRQFDSTRRLSPWLYRIAHNEFVDHLRAKSRAKLISLDFDIDLLLPHSLESETPETDFAKKEMADKVEKCLTDLDPKYREPLVLYYFEEMDYKAIAEIMKIPISTVGVRIKRAKDAIKKLCEK